MRLWGGGRFDDAPSDVLWRFTVDHSDRRLLGYDIRGSIAHVGMLGAVGILTGDEASDLTGSLEAILDEAEDGTFAWDASDEDVHSAVERRLTELAGDVAGKLHTGRSRNDQVALDMRLYMVDACDDLHHVLRSFIGVLVEAAHSVGTAVVPSYTHLQQAQAVPFAHHLLAYGWMLKRDAERLSDARARIAVSPLGAGASGGSSLPLDPADVAERLSLGSTFDNSMDAVGSRDLAAEFVWCVAQTMTTLSRLAEDLILWSSREFGWATFADAYTTGSSAMPHKKNADIAELVRGRAAAAVGDVVAALALQKGLPLTYNRDLQEMKRNVFRAHDSLAGALEALGGMVATASFHPPTPSADVTALDLAEVLVGRGVPFREAHHAVGRLVAALESEGRDLGSTTVEELVGVHGRFEPVDLSVIDPEASVERRATHGGGSFESVTRQIEDLNAWLV